MGARAMIDSATAKLTAAGIDTPRLDAELLLADAVGASRSEVIAGLIDVDGGEERFEAAVARRVEREPLAYITGRHGFRRIELAVDPRVLIPRPETELLVELIAQRRPQTILDVATGSGAIALALADELPDARILATDISADALVLAKANAAALGIDRVTFIESDLLSAVAGSFDAIAANLPYVERATLATLQPEVSQFEPRIALDGGEDGLDLVRALVESAPNVLNPGGLIALEIGLGQADETERILRSSGFTRVDRHRDLGGIERIVSAERAR